MYVMSAKFNDGSRNHIVGCLLVELRGFVSLSLKLFLYRGSYLQMSDQWLYRPTMDASLIYHE